MSVNIGEENRIDEKDGPLPPEIQQEIENALRKCYTCRKCISGCPVADEMDFPPAVILRWLALGQIEKVLKSRAIWLCSSCQNCYSRCPFEINIPIIIDLLREYAVKKDLARNERGIRLFHKSFLSEIKGSGRIHEMSLIAKWKIFSGHLFNDMLLGMKMFAKGKLSIFREKVKDREKFMEMFKP